MRSLGPCESTGKSEPIEVTVETASEALQRARKAVPLAEPITLTAGANLEQLVARSR